MGQRPTERGMAIVVTLFLMAALSALAASMMFLSQTETYASMNYRMMSQARYAAESAVQKASNYLLDTSQYALPGSVGDPLSNYNRNVSPVTYGGNPVVLSYDQTKSNYPAAAVKTAFENLFKNAAGQLSAGNVTLTYKATATLLTMQLFESYGGGQQVIQTWQITGDGSLQNLPNATVEVAGSIETPKVPASSYAVFATDNVCSALDLGGGPTINSYDSTGMTGGTAPTMGNFGGDVGTNGNLAEGGSVDLYGNLYTPRVGVGSCSAGNVTALSTTGHPIVPGQIVQLPSPVTYPTPQVPPYSTLADTGPITGAAGACNLLGFSGGTLGAVTCTESGSNITIDAHGTVPPTFPSLTLGSSTNLILVANTPPAQYNFNSIELDGGASIRISATAPTQNVFVNIVGKDSTGADITSPHDVLNLVGGTFASPVGCATCSNYDASMLQFLYAGTGDIELTGNSGAAATLYAPNADVKFEGTADLYGSILGKHVHNQGNASIHYDRRLKHDFWVAGHAMLSTFTWKRY